MPSKADVLTPSIIAGPFAILGSWTAAEGWKNVYGDQYRDQVRYENDAHAAEKEIQQLQARSDALSAANKTDEKEGFQVPKAWTQRVTDLSNKASATGHGSLHATIATDIKEIPTTSYSIMNAEVTGALIFAATAAAVTVFVRRRRAARRAHP
jgi:hypothetical protein